MVPLTGRSGLLVLLLGGTTVGRAQDSCISRDSDAQGFEVCRPATVPTAMGFDLPIIPEPQKAPTIVSLAPDDALGSPLKPSHCYGRTRGVLGRAAIGLSVACNAFGEQETCTGRLRRHTATGYPSGAPKACTSSVGLPSPHKQPKETCPRLIWPF